MSKTVDERIVEMRFDNKNFETNVATSISTLDKLKSSLKLDNATKGLENINSAAKKVDMSGLSNGLETVKSKFSALEIVGITTLSNITNSVVNSAKKITHSLTIAPITDGWQEYEMTLNSVQTTMAGTGKSVEEVERELKKLDEYADKTVYSTSDMLNNLPKFTNAGVELEKATTAMIGIANATALAGGDANKASIAFYNLGQAIGTGYLSRMDYNSINNAGIATIEWKNQMVNAALSMGTLTKVNDNLYKAGEKTYTLQQLFIDGLQTQWATTDVMMSVFQDYGNETTEIGKKAYSAAQDIKTFSMMMDSLKATSGTGWKDTWQIVFGGLDDAKVFWTGLNNFISKIITSVSDFRNNLLEGALTSPLNNLSKKLASLDSITSSAATKMQDYADVVNKVMNGDFGNGNARWDKLTASGYDWAKVQNLVNEQLGDSTRYTEKLTTEQGELIEQIETISDEKLKDIGLTDDEIKQYRKLERQAKETGISVQELINNLSADKTNGRTLLIKSFENIGKTLIQIFSSIKNAWSEIFSPITSSHIYDIIKGFNTLTEKIIIDEKNAAKLKTTFKGLFAALDLVRSVIGGALSTAFRIVSAVLSSFNLNILDVTAYIGNAILKFRDFVKENNLLGKAISTIVPFIKSASEAISKWIKNNEKIQNGIKKFKNILDSTISSISKWFDGLKETDNIVKYIITGFVNGIKRAIPTVRDVMIELGTKLLETIRGVLGIHSPSTEFFEIGENVIQGFVNGVKSGLSNLFSLFDNIGQKCLDIVSKIDFAKTFAVGIAGGMFYTANNMLKTIESVSNAIAAPAKGIGKMTTSIGNFFNALTANIKPNKWQKMSKTVMELAIAIGILSASVCLLAVVPTGKLLLAVGAIGALALILGTLSLAVSKMEMSGEGFGKLALMFVGLSASLLIMSSAIKKLEFLDGDNVLPILGGFAAMVGGLLAITFGLERIAKSDATKNIGKVGPTLLAVSGALLLMTMTAKAISGLDPAEFKKGIVCMTALGLLITALMFATKLAQKDISNIGSTIMRISAAMLLLVGVIKLVSGLNPTEITKGIICMTLFGGIITGLMAATKLVGNNADKIGASILGISGAMILMALTIKMVSGMEESEITKGIRCIALFGGIIAGLIATTRLAGGNSLKGVAITLLSMSISVGVLAGVAIVLSLIDLAGLAKGIVAVGMLSSLMALMIHSTKGAENCKASIVAMTVAIGLMAGAVAILSFIEPSRLASATLSMSAVMLSFAVMTKALSGMKVERGTIGSLALLGLIVAELAAILGALAYFNVQPSIETSASISVLLIAMSASLRLLNGVNKVAGSAIASLALLGLVVAELGLILGLMSKFNITTSMETVVNLSTLLIVMTGVLVVLSKVDKISLKAVAAMAILGAVVGELGLILGLLSTFNITTSIETALALSTLLLAMSAALVIISNIDKVSLKAAGAMVILGLVVGELGLVLGLMSKFNVEPSIETALALSTLLLAMSAALAILTLVGCGRGAVFEGLAALGVLIAGMAIIAGAIGALCTYFPNIEKFLNTGLPLLEKIGEGIGSFFGNIVGGFLEGVSSSLGEVGKNLSAFIVNLNPFFECLNGLDGDSANAAKTLAETILILTGAGVLDGIASLLGFGESSISKFGEQLEPFGKAIKDYGEAVKGIDISGVQPSLDAGKMLTDFAKTIPNSGGLVGGIVGNNDMGDFGKNIAEFGKAIVDYSNVVKGIDISGVQPSLDAGKMLTDFAKTIPNSGGLVGGVVGNNDMGDFGKNLVEFGKSLGEFSSAVLLINVEDVNSKMIGFTTAISELGRVGVEEFTKSFEDGTYGLTTSINTMINNTLTAIKKKDDDFIKAGEYLVDGFAKGIDENTFKAVAKAKAMAKKSYEAAKKELDEHSPSKKFAKIGAFVVEGFANGITKSLGISNDAAIKMADGVLTATQDELDINSPIVQGIAEGIKNDMSAEEAAEKKAQNIVQAFRSEFDKISQDISNREKDYELWELTVGETAPDAVIYSKQRKNLNDNLWDYNQLVALTTNEYITLRDMFGDENQYTREAYGRMKDAEINAAKANIELNSIDDSVISSQEEHLDNWKTINENSLEIMDLETSNGYIIPDAYKDGRYLEVYKDNIDIAKTKENNAKKAYCDALAKYGDENHSVVQEKKQALQEATKDLINAEIELSNYEDSMVEKALKKIEDNGSHTDDIAERWEAQYGDDASPNQRYLFYKNIYKSDVEDAKKTLKIYNDAYEDLVKEIADKNGITLEEARQTEKAVDYYNNYVYPAETKLIKSKKQISDLDKDKAEQDAEDLENQKKTLKESYQTASDIADIKYQIWELTTGRNATDAEKETMKLSFLTQQLSAQAKLVEMAKDAWKSASGDEKLEKEQEYWNAQLQLAQLQSDVLDIQEANTKRQQSALDKQRLAQDEYADYVKQYEKYYLDHGMTMADLERDAKLVSGYDPNKVTNTAINKTNSAIDTIKTNVTNLTKAVSDGIQNGVTEITTTTTSMLDSCADVLSGEKDNWFNAGVNMAEKLAEGIRSKIDTIVDTVSDLVYRSISAMHDSLENGFGYSSGISIVSGAHNFASDNMVAMRSSELTSYNLAKSIAKGYDNSNSNTDSLSKMQTPTYTFTQNNYSPKSLSAVEIYRQTNNMMSRVGKRVT